MSNNSNHKETDILKIWAKAGNTVNNQQQLNKEKMETLLNNTSEEFSSGIKRLLKADAILKVILIFGFIIVAAFNLANLFVLATTLVCLLIGAMVIKLERKFIEDIDDLQEFKGNIRMTLEKNVDFFKRSIFKYPFILSISVFMFYVLGSLTYHGIKYDIIKPIRDLEDAIVLISFLIFSVIFSFAVNYPFFRSRINDLKELLNDIDNDETIGEQIHIQKKKKRKEKLLISIMVLIGLIVLTALIVAYF